MRADELVEWRLPWPKARQTSFFDYPNPVLVEDLIIATIRSPGSLHAIDRETGERKWCYETERSLIAEPLVVGQVVFAQALQRLTALDLASGRRLWQTSTLTKGGLSTALVATDDLVFVGASDGNLHAFQISNRGQRWRYRASSRINGKPCLHEDRLIFGTNDGFLYALEIATGNLIWQKKIEEPVHTTGHLVEGNIQVESPYAIYEVAPSDGRIESEWRADRQQIYSVATDGVQTFVRVADLESIPVEGGPEGMRYRPDHVLCIAEGRTKWSLSRPPYSGGRLHYSFVTGYLYEATQAGLGIVNPKTGVRQWVVSNFRHKDGFPLDSTALPALASDRMHILTDDGSVLCLKHPWTHG